MNSGFPQLPNFSNLPHLPHLNFEFPQFLRGLIGILIAMVGLTAIDLFLARLERAEVGAEARRHFAAGERLAASKQYEDAAEEFRSAVSIDRENLDYRQAWARALFDGGLLDSAAEQARAALAADQSDGAANLLLARIQARQGDTADAIFSYRRAIYGRWPEGQDQRANVRWELTELLSKQGQGDEVLAELLLLQSESPNDTEVRRRVARLYLEAGFPAQAAPVYQELVRQNSGDASAYAGLAESQFQTGDLRSAAANFQFAAQLDANDKQSAERYAVIRRIQALDPAARRLASAERTVRAVAIMRAVVDDAQACARQQAGQRFSDEWRRVSELLKDRSALRRQENPVEWAMGQADQLNKARAAACPNEKLTGVDAQAVSYLLRSNAE